MCYVQLIVAAIAIVASVAQNQAQNRQNRKIEQAVNAQAKQRNEQIDQAATAEMNERARAVRRAKASARAAASESGINLDSGSFLGQLNAMQAQDDMNAGLVAKNAQNQKAGVQTERAAALSRIQYKTGLGIALDAAVAGYGAYSGAGGTVGKGATDSWTPVFGGSSSAPSYSMTPTGSNDLYQGSRSS